MLDLSQGAEKQLHNIFFKRLYLFIFLDRGEGREKERKRNINVWLPLSRPLLGTWTSTQACALIGNQTFCSQAGIQSTEPLQPDAIA